MDFSLLHEHPWTTVAIIGGGGLILFIVLRGRGASSSGGQTIVNSGADPSVTAANSALSAQQDQIQGSLSGLSIQGQTQLALGQLAAGVQTHTIDASQDITNRQTAAQLQYGLGTLDAQVASEALSAGIQSKYIDALVAAFRGPGVTGGGGVAANVGGYNGTPILNSPTNPVNQYIPMTQGVTYPAAGTGGTAPTSPTPAGSWPSMASYGLDPGGGGFHCDPMDSACVASQNIASNTYVAAVAGAQVANNRQRELDNYRISIDAGVITPAQLAEYRALGGV